MAATLFDGLLASVGQWMTSIVALGWRAPAVADGEIASVSVVAMTGPVAMGLRPTETTG